MKIIRGPSHEVTLTEAISRSLDRLCDQVIYWPYCSFPYDIETGGYVWDLEHQRVALEMLDADATERMAKSREMNDAYWEQYGTDPNP